MRTFMAFLHKEFIEGIRNKKTIIMMVIFCIFGIMNPMMAKITPWMMEAMSESLKESGIETAEVTVNALTSWQQFFKNIPMALIAFILMYGSTFTHEYEKNTLVNIVTKGFSRWKIVIAKTFHLVAIWTIGMMVCAGLTTAYNEYYWDNSIAHNIFGSIALYWVFGLFVIGLLILFSTLCRGNGSVLTLTAGTIMILYMISIWEKAAKYLPLKLGDGMSIMTGATKIGDYTASTVVTVIAFVVCIAGAIVEFNRRQL